MQQILGFIVLSLFFIFTFIPLSYLNMTRTQAEETKQCLNLSVKALANSLQVSKANFDELSRGYTREGLFSVEIDRDRLLRECNDLMYKNSAGAEKFEHLKSRIRFKGIVYYDRFFIADAEDRWGPPYFFTYNAGGRLYYMNTRNDSVYSYNHAGSPEYGNISDIGRTGKEKNEMIIDTLNRTIAGYTGEKPLRQGLNIKIRNPENDDAEYKRKYSYFNALEGITFFIVYADQKEIYINRKDFTYKNYNVAGYTLE